MLEDSKTHGHQDGRPTTRRRLLQTGAAVSGIAVAGCMGNSGDTLRFIDLGGSTQDAEREKFQEWGEENDVTIKDQEASTNTEMLNIISNNPGSFDFTNLAHFGLAMEDIQYDNELLASIDTGEVPNYEENVQEQWKNAPPLENRDDGLFYYMSSQGVGYNRDYVDEITSWEDLKVDDLEGHVSYYSSPPTRFGSCCAALGYNVSEALNDDDMFDDVFVEMEEQHQNVFNYWEAGDQFMQWMREEQAYACGAWGGRTQILNEEEGHPIEYVIPEEGAVAHTNYLTIIEDSDNKDLVYDLFNWLYERENAIDLSTMHKYPFGLTDPPEELTSLYEYVEGPDTLTWMDWGEVVPELDRIQERITEIRTN